MEEVRGRSRSIVRAGGVRAGLWTERERGSVLLGRARAGVEASCLCWNSSPSLELEGQLRKRLDELTEDLYAMVWVR